MILKKKELIAASLVVLIGMAGYLNWSYQDTMRVEDNESYVATGKTLGEAEMVLANNEVTEEEATSAPANSQEGDEQKEEDNTAPADEEMANTKYFEEAKMNRESARAAAMEALKTTSSDTSIDEATRTLAGEKLVACAQNIEVESKIESIASAKGFPDTCAYINEGTATLTVKTDGLSNDDVAKLTDIVTGNCDVGANKVKIIEVK